MENLLLSVTNIKISFTDLSLAIFVSTILGLALMLLRRFSNVSTSYDTSFDFTLIFMPSIVAIIMMFIGSNLTLSIGLIGSLSIIRFRTVIKNASDMFYLFWVIAIGLGCGTYNLVQIIFASIFIGVIILFINKFYLSRSNVKNIPDAILIVHVKKNIKTSLISDILKKYQINFKIKSVEYTDDNAEYCFSLLNNNTYLNQKNIEKIIEELNSSPEVEKISILSPEINLDS